MLRSSGSVLKKAVALEAEAVPLSNSYAKVQFGSCVRNRTALSTPTRMLLGNLAEAA